MCCLQNGEDSNNNFFQLFCISKSTAQLECKLQKRLAGTWKAFTVHWKTRGGKEDKLLMMALKVLTDHSN